MLGTIGRGTALDPLLGQPGAQFDGTRFNWIGSANDEVSVCVAWHTSGFSTFDDVLRRELLIGGTGPGDDTIQFGKVLVGVLGAKLKIISGYPGGNDAVLAMERGELQGRCGWSYSSIKAAHPDWLATKKIAILVQLALAKHPELPDVPLITDLAKTEEQQQLLKFVFARQVMGRPYLAPPGVPPATVAALRRAFMETMADKDFLADAARGKLEITPVSGERIQALVAELYKTPPELAKRLGGDVEVAEIFVGVPVLLRDNPMQSRFLAHAGNMSPSSRQLRGVIPGRASSREPGIQAAVRRDALCRSGAFRVRSLTRTAPE